MPNPTELLTTGAAARLADVSPATIRLWQRSGRLVPAVRATSGLALYARQDVERVVAQRHRQPAEASQPQTAAEANELGHLGDERNAGAVAVK